ncbi:MAG: hypothetical protein HRT77_07625 [Halioglobus sp.]|nr:hypothetical protein [Halioglobus sp.]
MGLTEREKEAIKESYLAGQTLAILSPSTIDVEALHRLLGAGAAYTSTTDPVLLAYIIRRENSIPSSRVLLNIRPSPNTADDPGADDRAYARAYNMLVGDLSRPPLPSNESASILADGPVSLSNNALQYTLLSTTTGGIYNTPVNIYAGHACAGSAGQPAFDFYVVTAGGDWTPTEAHYESASEEKGQVSLSNNDDDLSIDWQTTDDYCTGGIAVDKGIGGGGDSRVCRYMNYPLDYRVSLLPPAGTTTKQVNASPSADQGKSTTYSSGFSFSIGANVNISGKGPGAGLQAGATWSQSVQTTVPALVVKAGIVGNQGSFTQYNYCTAGTTVENCTSTIQATGQKGLCDDYVIGDPQNGQTPNGRLSNIGQSVYWQVVPSSYGDNTSYDITVNWDVTLATSTARLWGGAFDTGTFTSVGPTGQCNGFGCSCSVGSNTSKSVETSHTFKVPLPSTDCP